MTRVFTQPRPVADSFDFYADLALVVSGSGVVGAIWSAHEGTRIKNKGSMLIR
jgi:hypothetical protein